MTWARFEDRFPWHRKVRPLSDAAFRLHVSAICWCCEHLTDGRVKRTELPLVSDVKRPNVAANELTTAGLWRENDERTGWELHDFLTYNESRDVIVARREADAERKRRGRESRPSSAKTPAKAADVQPDSERTPPGQAPGLQAESTPESGRPGPSRPEPTTQPPPGVVAATAANAPVKASRGTRIPDTFPLTELLLAWGREHAPAVDGRAETENWLDWHRAKGDTAKDWAASWRTWMRRAQKDAESPRQGRLRAVDNRRSGDDVVRENHATGQAWLARKQAEQRELGA